MAARRERRPGRRGRRGLAALTRGARVDALLAAAAAWARARPDVVALALVGSHARDAARPDSDVDLVVLCRDPAALLADRSWARRFGPVARETVEDWGAVTSLRVAYDGGPEVEYGLARPSWAALPLDPGTRRVAADGLRALHDPAGLLAGVRAAVAARS